jgi:hypothetical protein
MISQYASRAEPADHERLRKENILRRAISPFFLKEQLRMADRRGEIVEIIAKTGFARSHRIQAVTLGSLPIRLSIELTKA